MLYTIANVTTIAIEVKKTVMFVTLAIATRAKNIINGGHKFLSGRIKSRDDSSIDFA